jgi:hypothetical protein
MKKHLQGLLEDLHGELADASSLDDQARQQLRVLAQEIETAVGDEDADALNRLQSAALGLETQHPRITGILASIADTLSKLGI